MPSGILASGFLAKPPYVLPALCASSPARLILLDLINRMTFVYHCRWRSHSLPTCLQLPVISFPLRFTYLLLHPILPLVCKTKFDTHLKWETIFFPQISVLKFLQCKRKDGILSTELKQALPGFEFSLTFFVRFRSVNFVAKCLNFVTFSKDLLLVFLLLIYFTFFW